jgi:hypothetical protein
VPSGLYTTPNTESSAAESVASQRGAAGSSTSQVQIERPALPAASVRPSGLIVAE